MAWEQEAAAIASTHRIYDASFAPNIFLTAPNHFPRVIDFFFTFQEDGTWTDFPRCVEHEPGREVQISGFCPGVSGYCSDSRIGQRCTFPCAVGPDVDSVCTSDGTW